MDLSVWINSKNYKKTKLGYFQSLCEAIVSQQLSGKAAETIFGRFEKLFPNKNIDPNKLLEFEDKKLKNVGMSWAKVSYVKSVAEHVSNDLIAWNKLDEMDDEGVIKEVTKIKGIGRWTAEMFLMFTLGRENVFSYGDLGLKKGIEKIYRLDNPAPDAIKKITDKWIPYRSYGSIALWQSLE